MRPFVWHWYWHAGPLFGVFLLVSIAGFAFVLWMLIDAINRPAERFSTPNAKTGWIVGLIAGLVVGFGFLGVIVALAYLVTVRIPARANASIRAMPGEPGSTPGAYPPPPAPPPSLPSNCPNCGAKLVPGARFCHSCGTPIT